jgi:hypothetical protein
MRKSTQKGVQVLHQARNREKERRRIASKIFYNKFHKNANTIGIISGFAAQNKSFFILSLWKKSLSEQAIKMNNKYIFYEDVSMFVLIMKKSRSILVPLFWL